MKGSFNNCINFNYKFDSKVAEDICKQKGLPKGTNVAEGIVIRPILSSIKINIKSNIKINLKKDKIRPLIKIKNPLFAEISGDFTLPNVTCNMVLLTMVNMNRYNCIVSKIGKINESNIDMFIKTFMEDVWTDYYEKYLNVQIEDWKESNNLLYEKIKQLVIINNI